MILAIEYDARGQRTRIQYANYTSTKYEYDPLTFRVRRILTIRSSDSRVLQDLRYFYDAAGNITTQRDDAQQTVFFDNSVVTPDNYYTYDALYRLVKAEGREHTASNIPSGWSDEQRMRLPHLSDATAVQRYAERYTYDAVGNIGEVKHTATSGAWTRTLTVESGSNRLRSMSVSTASETYTHDARGNLTEGFAHLAGMAYNEGNRLEVVQLTGDRTAYYQYDGGGQRTRKTIVDTSTDIREERKYLGGWEVYTKWEGGTLALQRETLHLADDAGRVALIDTRTEGDGDEPQQLLRYQYSNHLGSASLELDSAGAIISYEEYHPYGTTSFQSGRSVAEVILKRYRYTGKERDEETGLNYHGARYYAPWLARWTAVDPLESKYAGLSPYNYCIGNPVMYHDPDGRQVGGGDDKSKPAAQTSAAAAAGAAAAGASAGGTEASEAGAAQAGAAIGSAAQPPIPSATLPEVVVRAKRVVPATNNLSASLPDHFITHGLDVPQRELGTMRATSEREIQGYNAWHDVKEFSNTSLGRATIWPAPQVIDAVVNPISLTGQQLMHAATGQRIVRNLDGTEAWDANSKSQADVDARMMALVSTIATLAGPEVSAALKPVALTDDAAKAITSTAVSTTTAETVIDKGFKTLSELGMYDGMRTSSDEVLELAEQFLGKGYTEPVADVMYPQIKLGYLEWVLVTSQVYIVAVHTLTLKLLYLIRLSLEK